MSRHPLIHLVENYPLITDIADSFGTPVYIYSKERLIENSQRLFNALSSHFESFHICYAIKANSNPHLIRALKEGVPNMGGDCSSPGEIYAAKLAEISPDRCIYTGNYESTDELINAIKMGCFLNLDDISTFNRLRQIMVPDSISFRLNPGFGKGTFSQITTAGENAKFGIPKEKIIKAYRLAKEAGVKQFGIQCMAGSGVLDESYFPKLLNAILTTTRQIEKSLHLRMSFISLGGGYGIPYTPDETPLDLNKMFKELSQVFYTFYPKDPDSPTLWIEPGKILVGDAGLLVAKVNGIKNSYKTYVGLDAGMETLMRPALYGAYHQIYKVGHVNAALTAPVDFTGPICENTDRLAINRPAPKLEEGDWVAIMDAGAYGFSMSHNFNTRPRAAEVLIDGNAFTLIRKRETIKELFTACDL